MPKRKTHPEEVESPPKRPASQRDDTSSEEEEREEEREEEQEGDQPWERRAGMILEVSMRNFMCHEVRPRSCPDISLDDLHDVLL